VVTWRCRSLSMYGGTEVDRALCVMTAILMVDDTTKRVSERASVEIISTELLSFTVETRRISQLSLDIEYPSSSAIK